MFTYAIGDIHGSLRKLRGLMARSDGKHGGGEEKEAHELPLGSRPDHRKLALLRRRG